jgi:hypothetical protein
MKIDARVDPNETDHNCRTFRSRVRRTKTCLLAFLLSLIAVCFVEGSEQRNTPAVNRQVADFQDPDGHLWEIAWNPAWKVKE